MRNALPRPKPDQHGFRDIVFADDCIVSSKAAEFALDEIGLDRRRGSLQQPGAFFGTALMVAQSRKAGFRLLSRAAQGRRLLGENLVPEQIQS